MLQLRFQKCVDAHPEITQKVATAEQEKAKEKPEKDKDKVSCLQRANNYMYIGYEVPWIDFMALS